MVSVGIRDFRTELASFVDGDEPVQLTRHGQTVGWFIPTRAKSLSQYESLLKAGELVGQLISDSKASVDELVEDFAKLRSEKGVADAS